MSKRAEEAALKAYPNDKRKVFHSAFGTFEIDNNAPYREGYVQGYEQAEKDTIELAVAWLKENADKYIVDCTETYPDAPFKAVVGGMCWEDMKKALE